MISSMTAFSRAERIGEYGQIVWEIRTVNHRYLDLVIRMPEDLRSLESEVRDRIGAKVRRGKVDCILRHDRAAENNQDIRVNSELAGRLVRAAESIEIAGPTLINRLDVLRWPGVLEKPAVDMEALGGTILELLDQTLHELVQMRKREGEKIREMILQRCSAATGHVSALRAQLPQILDGVRERYLQRAREMQVNLDNDRLEQEMLMLAQKMDVAEELDRFEAHVTEVTRALEQRDPVGRRLDFLMQEMNRESNTLGSKSVSLEMSNASVELKVLIEQMREQVQNVE